MPIISIASGAITQACAACGAHNTAAVDSLVVGVSRGGRTNDDAIQLPACGCGAVEVMIRTFDACPPEFAGSHLDLHRRAVNALSRHLISEGKSAPESAAHHEADQRVAPDIAPSLEIASIPLPAA